MKPKHHFFYGGIALVIVVALVMVEVLQTRHFTSLLAAQSSQLQTQINDLQQQHSALGEEVETLTASVTEKETQIKKLSGQLEQVKIENQEQLEQLDQQISTLKAQNADFSSVIEESIPSVVSIRTNLGSGSGFIISSEGYIVTNEHVISGATAASVITSDGRQHAVYLVGADARADVAVLQIEGSYDSLRWGDSDNIVVGEKVIAIGNPGGLDFTVTQGIVSATDREDQYGNLFAQIDVPINPGNSGGPLLNAEGRVIGITTKKISEFEGVGFALESNQARDIAEGLISVYETQS